jgi:hypothetical protein
MDAAAAALDTVQISAMTTAQLHAAMLGHRVEGTEQWLHTMQRLLRTEAHDDLFLHFLMLCPRRSLEVCFRTLLSLHTPNVTSLRVLLNSRPRQVFVDPLPQALYPDAPVPLLDADATPPLTWAQTSLWSHLVVWHLSEILDRHRANHTQRVREALSQLHAGALADDPGLTFRVVASVQAAMNQMSELEEEGLEQGALDAVEDILAELSQQPTKLGKCPIDFMLRLLRVLEILLQSGTRVELGPAFSVKFLFQLAGGRTAVCSPKVRELVCDAIALLPHSSTPAGALGPRVVHDIAAAFVELPALPRLCVIKFMAVLAEIDALLEIDFARADVYLYERAVHRILERAMQPNSSLCGRYGWEVVLGMLRRLSESRPGMNVVECVFWRLTNSLMDMYTEDVIALRPALSMLVRTRGNRAVIRELWGLCDETELRPWQLAFGSTIAAAVAPCTAPGAEPPMDALTQQRVRRLFWFAPDRIEGTGVGLETLLQHVAVGGWTNPFTNEPITWDAIVEANPSLGQRQGDELPGKIVGAFGGKPPQSSS